MVASKTKLKLTYITIGFYFLLGGVEYAVILPTLWLYLRDRFGAEPYMLGLVLAAFPLTGIVAGPLMGRWSDKTKNTKIVLLVSNVFEIVGSFMYFLGNNFSAWFLVGSRLVAGIGTGAGAAVFADIARVTTAEERTGVMSIFMAVRQLGLLAGPGCNLFLRELDFHIGSFPVDKYTAPGLFMALLWLILQIMVFFMYWNLPQLKLQLEIEQQESLYRQQSTESILEDNDVTPSQSAFSPESQSDYSVQNKVGFSINGDEEEEGDGEGQNVTEILRHSASIQNHIIPTEVNEDYVNVASSSDMIENAELIMNRQTVQRNQKVMENSDEPVENSVPNDIGNSTYGTINGAVQNGSSAMYTETISQDEEEVEPKTYSWRYLYDDLMRDEVIAILATVFVAFFNQTALETLCTPLTALLLNWGELENSIMYCLAGVELVLMFAFIRLVLSKFISDRNLLIIGVIMETGALCFNLWFIPQAPPYDEHRNIVGLIVGLVLDLAGLPIIVVCAASLYSKITCPETQGFNQGIRRVAGSIGTILGPLWPGGMMNHMYPMFGVMVAVNCFGLVLLVASYPRLKEKQPSSTNTEVEAENGETSPLIRAQGSSDNT